MADLLLGVSELLEQQQMQGWEPDPDLASMVSPTLQFQETVQPLAPSVESPYVQLNAPQFFADATPAGLSQREVKLRRLIETATSRDGVSLDQLLTTPAGNTPTLSAAQRQQRLAALQATASRPNPGTSFAAPTPASNAAANPTATSATESPFDFSAVTDPATASPFDFSTAVPELSATSPFDFGNAIPEGNVTSPSPTGANAATAAQPLAQPSDNASTVASPTPTTPTATTPEVTANTTAPTIPAKPNFAPPRVETALSFASTPQALVQAQQQVIAPQGPRPGSGSQLYGQRQAALRAGSLYTRVSPDSYYDQWVNATAHPTYEQWKGLLEQEANAIAKGQGQNQLTVVVGDSLSQWLPADMLPQDRFWLNQGISGDTTHGILNRLSAFSNTRPDTIHVMAGVNDLKNGATDSEVLVNLERIMGQLKQQHPESRIIIHSILPTRLAHIPSDRIRDLNLDIAQVAERQRVVYLDLHPSFTDEMGNLRYELTTDGLHLSRLGYQVWQIAMLAL